VLITYQWQFNGANITDATNTSLVVPNFQKANQGAYSVVVNVTTNVPVAPATFSAQISLVGAPQITSQPLSQSVKLGSNATFSVVATGNATLTYQWKFNGNSIGGQTGSSLTVANAQLSNEGAYTVAVSNSIGGIISQPAQLTVLVPPLLSQPQHLPNGNFQARLQGGANHSYVIETSSNLSQWSALTTLFYTNGTMPFVDTTASNAATRFYRARSGP